MCARCGDVPLLTGGSPTLDLQVTAAIDAWLKIICSSVGGPAGRGGSTGSPIGGASSANAASRPPTGQHRISARAPSSRRRSCAGARGAAARSHRAPHFGLVVSAAEPPQLFDDVERLVLVAVDVRRRLESLADGALDGRESPVGVLDLRPGR